MVRNMVTWTVLSTSSRPVFSRDSSQGVLHFKRDDMQVPRASPEHNKPLTGITSIFFFCETLRSFLPWNPPISIYAPSLLEGVWFTFLFR